MQDPTVEIVANVLGVLDELVVPHVSAPEARAFADICSRLLHQVVVRERQFEGFLAKRDAKASAVSDRLARLLDALPPPAAGAPDLRAPDQLTRAFGIRLDAVDSAIARSIGECVRSLVQTEREFLESLDPEVSFGIASMFAGGRVDRERVKFGRTRAGASGNLGIEALRSRLRRIGSAWEDVEIKSLTRIQGGFSKQTLRLELIAAPWGGSHFIIRRDRPNAYTGTTVADEFPVIRAMFDAGLRVPEPLWLEHAGEIEPAFIVVRQAAGANDVSDWKDDVESANRFLNSLARQMALLHRIPVERSGLKSDRSASVSHLIRTDIERWSALARLDEPGAPALLVGERAWLLQNIPSSAREPVVVHSDIGFHNMLSDMGEVTALLDWEFCHLGDPQEDLNYVRPFVEIIGSWDRFLENYMAAGGHRFRPEDALFWKVWGSYRSGAGCHSALHAFNERSFGSAAEAATLAVSGLNFGPRYQLEVAELIAGASPA